MNFSDEDIYEAVKHHLPSVNEYVNSHGGAITLLGVKNGKIYIELTGACHGCSMSLMTTKMVVQKRLRELIHPELVVVNVDGTPENALPEDLYTKEKPEEEVKEKEEESIWGKVKKIF
ncbi:NifU family protein [Sulfurovum sp.]|uniref:NifU family protein n=1 Tax=Sulfurovum sp. TaxID=1969726 RepID=UPI0025CC5012|nr:NifU family protein [Sulfurovum sp.]